MTAAGPPGRQAALAAGASWPARALPAPGETPPTKQEPRSRDCDAGRGRRGRGLPAAPEPEHTRATRKDRP